MVTEQINHDTAHTFMNTGFRSAGRPSMGSWITYGLGSESEDLPGFVVLTSEGGAQSQPIAARQWHSGFLPSRYQGVKFQSGGEPVSYVRNPPGVSRDNQSGLINAVGKLNRIQGEMIDDPEISTRIAQYELAFRMQMSVPELVDFSNEPQHILDMYGATGDDGSYASNCLLARRLGRNAACASSISTIAAGTITAISRTASRKPAASSIEVQRRWSKTSSSADCSTRH